MLKFSNKEINTLYESLTSYLQKNPDSINVIVPLLEKLYETGKIKVSEKSMLINESVQSSKSINFEKDPLVDFTENYINEYYQLQDTVRLNKTKGYIIGQIEGKNIVMIQGNTYLVDDNELTEYKKKIELTTLPHVKFDEETQKLLFEQHIKCGIYMGNIPVKLTDCFVKYDSWEKAQPDQQIKVLVEGNTTFFSKSQIKIFEDINDFANPDNYIPGVVIDSTTEDALENVLINAIDYSNAIGDSDAVKIIRNSPSGTQELQTMPRSSLRTLAV